MGGREAEGGGEAEREGGWKGARDWESDKRGGESDGGGLGRREGGREEGSKGGRERGREQGSEGERASSAFRTTTCKQRARSPPDPAPLSLTCSSPYSPEKRASVTSACAGDIL